MAATEPPAKSMGWSIGHPGSGSEGPPDPKGAAGGADTATVASLTAPGPTGSRRRRGGPGTRRDRVSPPDPPASASCFPAAPSQAPRTGPSEGGADGVGRREPGSQAARAREAARSIEEPVHLRTRADPDLASTPSRAFRQVDGESGKPKLLDRVREAIRLRHYSDSTEKAYLQWVRRFIFFHGVRHPLSSTWRLPLRTRPSAP